MSAERVVQIVGGFLEAIRNRDGLEPFLAPEATLEVAGAGNPLRGAAAVAQGMSHHYGAEFDAQPELVRLVADDSGAAAEILFVGTHIGEYEGLAPTGRAVRVPMSYCFDVGGDGITALRIYYSAELALAQLRGEPGRRGDEPRGRGEEQG